jgi:hypothetical protein
LARETWADCRMRKTEITSKSPGLVVDIRDVTKYYILFVPAITVGEERLVSGPERSERHKLKKASRAADERS